MAVLVSKSAIKGGVYCRGLLNVDMPGVCAGVHYLPRPTWRSAYAWKTLGRNDLTETGVVLPTSSSEVISDGYVRVTLMSWPIYIFRTTTLQRSLSVCLSVGLSVCRLGKQAGR